MSDDRHIQQTEGEAAQASSSSQLFDLRYVIAALLAVYGVILLAMGLFATSAEDLDKAGGVNINLWTGLALLVAAALFALWGRLSPLNPAATAPADGEGATGGHAGQDR